MGLRGEFLQGLVSLIAALGAVFISSPGVSALVPGDNDTAIIALGLFVATYVLLLVFAYLLGALSFLRVHDSKRARFVGDYVSEEGDTISVFSLRFDGAARTYYISGDTIALAKPEKADGSWWSVDQLHFDKDGGQIRYIYRGAGEASRSGSDGLHSYGLAIMEFNADLKSGQLRFRDDLEDAKYMRGKFERIDQRLRRIHLGSAWTNLRAYADKRRFAQSYAAERAAPASPEAA